MTSLAPLVAAVALLLALGGYQGVHAHHLRRVAVEHVDPLDLAHASYVDERRYADGKYHPIGTVLALTDPVVFSEGRHPIRFTDEEREELTREMRADSRATFPALTPRPAPAPPAVLSRGQAEAYAWVDTPAPDAGVSTHYQQPRRITIDLASAWRDDHGH